MGLNENLKHLQEQLENGPRQTILINPAELLIAKHVVEITSDLPNLSDSGLANLAVATEAIQVAAAQVKNRHLNPKRAQRDNIKAAGNRKQVIVPT